MAIPTAEEQLLLEYINAARMDPLGDAARYIAGFGTPATSNDPDINSSMRFFGVSGPALQAALAGLTPVQPLAWNEKLADAAQGHNAAMIAADQQTHQAPAEPDLGQRFTAAGYNFQAGGENVFAFATNPLEAHAGFMVDWGNGPNGMQSPAGHRDNIMSADFREAGLALTHENNAATQVGPLVVTEDLGARFGGGALILGVAYNDASHDDFYSIGEGVGGLTVSVGSASVANYATGGYALQAGSGAQTVTFTGGGLAGAVSVGLSLSSTSNVKLDIVSGSELKTSASATVSGAVSTIEGMGATGLSLTSAGGVDRTVLGTSGADTLAAAGGHNVLRGNSGADSVSGGAGFDDINGNMGNDTAHGNAGDDWVVGGKDDDSLSGDDGGDIVFGNLGNDTCDGGAGNDIVRGGQGADTLAGGAGNDFVSGDRGDDTMTGGAGADMFHSSSDAGIDRVLDFNYAEGDRVQLDPGTRFTAAQMGADTVVTMATSADQVILVGVQLSSLPSDWIFGA